MGKVPFGEKNPNWKGGRVVDPRGYVLLRRPGHHMADVRGYVYEHRLRAEEKIGRPLMDDEHVHHLNEDKSDNRPENLEVLSAAEHRARHRKEGSDRRDPGESNPEVECACGCGERFLKFDEAGRPRTYVGGHNPRPSPTRDAIFDALSRGITTTSGLIEATGRAEQAIKVCLSKLVKEGRLVRIRRGTYARVDSEVNDVRK